MGADGGAGVGEDRDGHRNRRLDGGVVLVVRPGVNRLPPSQAGERGGG